KPACRNIGSALHEWFATRIAGPVRGTGAGPLLDQRCHSFAYPRLMVRNENAKKVLPERRQRTNTQSARPATITSSAITARPPPSFRPRGPARLAPLAARLNGRGRGPPC